MKKINLRFLFKVLRQHPHQLTSYIRTVADAAVDQPGGQRGELITYHGRKTQRQIFQKLFTFYTIQV